MFMIRERFEDENNKHEMRKEKQTSADYVKPLAIYKSE
jgi:hypothetical protein